MNLGLTPYVSIALTVGQSQKAVLISSYPQKNLRYHFLILEDLLHLELQPAQFLGI
jgi:hypothetical protein